MISGESTRLDFGPLSSADGVGREQKLDIVSLFSRSQAPTVKEAEGSRGPVQVGRKEDPVTVRTPADGVRETPEATVARLPVYLRALTSLADDGVGTCSSDELARVAGVNGAMLRKDLSYLGSYGTRGVGYEVAYLRHQIALEIGVTQDLPVVIVGIGNLGQALASYSGFGSRGFRISALLDADPDRHGEIVAGLAVRDFDELEAIVAEHGVAIGIIATPGDAAQDVVNRLVASGVSSILNFAPGVVTVPDGVDLRKVDLSIELQILAYHEQRKATYGGGQSLAVADGQDLALAEGQAP
jgi:redox-sensing transcriptional repressor